MTELLDAVLFLEKKLNYIFEQFLLVVNSVFIPGVVIEVAIDSVDCEILALKFAPFASEVKMGEIMIINVHIVLGVGAVDGDY